MSGVGATLPLVLLLNLSQLSPCGPGPEQRYKRFAKKAAEGKCSSVYSALDRRSRAQLDAYLETMLTMALTVELQKLGEPPTLQSYYSGPALSSRKRQTTTAADQDSNDEDGGVSADAGTDELSESTLAVAAMRADAPAELLAKNERRAELEALGELRGRALFKALCKSSMPKLSYLFREAGLEGYHPIPIEEVVEVEDKAELFPRNAAKGAKGAAQNTLHMVKENDRWRLVLQPMNLTWYSTEDGRLVPRFRSPILTLGVEPDQERTPTAAYNHIVKLVAKGDCQAFYELLDTSSRNRMEQVGPMMVGFASAMGAARGGKPQARDGRSLVLALCKEASPSELRAAGFHLGEVENEEISNNMAALTVKSRGTDETREILMVREHGNWHLSIEAFGGLATAEEDQEEDDEEGDGAEEDE